MNRMFDDVFRGFDLAPSGGDRAFSVKIGAASANRCRASVARAMTTAIRPVRVRMTACSNF
jgi:hypothetical protein